MLELPVHPDVDVRKDEVIAMLAADAAASVIAMLVSMRGDPEDRAQEARMRLMRAVRSGYRKTPDELGFRIADAPPMPTGEPEPLPGTLTVVA